MDTILSNKSVSITELKRSPSAVISAADDDAVAILIHNKPSAYLLSAEAYEQMLERLDDLELAQTVRARADEPRVEVGFDEL